MASDALTRQEIESHELLEEFVNSYMYRVHTSAPAIVVSFDEDKNTVDVQPCIMRKMIGQDPKPLPIIKNCPVNFYGAGGYAITFKPQAGDECDLIFNDRSLDAWKRKGGVIDSGNPRHHDITDAKAYFGIRSYPNAIDSLRNGIDIRSTDGATSFHLESGTITLTVNGNQTASFTNGAIVLAVGGVTVATLTAGGINFSVPVTGTSGTFGGKVVETHTHLENGAGNQTGAPT